MKKKIAKLDKPRILELYIELETTPKVWRKFLIDDSSSMYELHEIIQVVMGWMNSHLFMFRIAGLVIAEPSPNADDDWREVEFKDARRVKVSQILEKPGDTMPYEYDFGDSWDHTLRLERVVDESEVMFSVPRCVAGENACPPEDCGSFPGFENLKEVISDPENEEYERMIHWLDQYYPNYDPTEFSLGAVNKILKIGASKFLKLAPTFYAGE